jgi:hypothetical protein
MFEYLKRAFWAGPSVPGLGRLPVNALAAVGFGILGFGHPAFWLLGLGLEAAYLTAVASHPRFQRLVDAQRHHQSTAAADQSRQELIQKLDSQARNRQGLIEMKCEQILRIARESQAGDFELESQREALDRLSWIHLKLLVARHHLEASRVHTSEADLERKIADLERDLAASGSPSALRESKAATLKLLQQRLENLSRCEDTLKQVDSDLSRIEAQVDLALESAGLRGSGAAVTANLELAGQILDEDLYFGDSEAAVLALERAYSAPPARERA